MQQTIDPTIDSMDESTKRPSFLSVLCIITFLYSAYNFFVNGLAGFFGSGPGVGDMDQMFDQLQASMDSSDPEMARMMNMFMDAGYEYVQLMIENSTLLGVTIMVVAALSFFGAYKMWKLQKTGFYIYLGAKVLGILIPLIVFGSNVLYLIFLGVSVIVGALFVILYAVNLKYMH